MDPVESARPTSIQVSVAWSAEPGRASECVLEVAQGASVHEAIQASGILERFPALDISTSAVGVWGRACGLQAGLSAGDRVEIYRPLVNDPKQARRMRAARPAKTR